MIPDNEVRLSHMAPGGGCAAKIGPGTLQGILEQLPRFSDENLLVGIETSDDGAVYRISPELALIQTLDFFPPMVDDPLPLWADRRGQRPRSARLLGRSAEGGVKYRGPGPTA